MVNGNVVWRQKVKESLNLLESSTEVLETTTSRFDLQISGLRNPYTFPGTTNQNLIRSSQTTSDNGKWLYSEKYRYEYDAKDRVRRYLITSDSYITVGTIDYINP
ncbi:hypothetical protein [Spirosoma fluminis]